MHSFYLENLEIINHIIELTKEESKHFKVLRIKDYEQISVTDGKGNFYKCLIEPSDSKNILLRVLESLPNNNENNKQIDLLFSNLQNKSSNELIIEKACELGVKNIYIFFSDRSQSKNVNIDRLKTKAISALKQSNRSLLPSITIIANTTELEKIMDDYPSIVLGDMVKSENDLVNKEKILILVGPEGGFSKEELELFDNHKSVVKLKLGSSILKTETAAISLISRFI